MPGRSRVEIYAEVLECCRKGAPTSLIIHKCNLKYPLFKECIEFLKSRKLLEEINKEGKKIFKNTEKGNEALNSYAKFYLRIFEEAFRPSMERRNPFPLRRR